MRIINVEDRSSKSSWTVAEVWGERVQKSFQYEPEIKKLYYLLTWEDQKRNPRRYKEYGLLSRATLRMKYERSCEAGNLREVIGHRKLLIRIGQIEDRLLYQQLL